MLADSLCKKILIVCPVDRVMINDNIDKSKWIITYSANATAQQKIDAQVVIDNFVWDSATKEDNRKDNRNDNYKTDLSIKGLYAQAKLAEASLTFSSYLDRLESAVI